ncbi:MAG: hypothetical protein NTU58_03505 [Candidatus Nealsonbacteria bacterium]|nr:hypothetical protein [Candidatus Nealsonbacteria bacterium]
MKRYVIFITVRIWENGKKDVYSKDVCLMEKRLSQFVKELDEEEGEILNLVQSMNDDTICIMIVYRCKKSLYIPQGTYIPNEAYVPKN